MKSLRECFMPPVLLRSRRFPRERGEERKLGQKKCFLFDDAFGWLVGPGELELVVATFPSVSKFPIFPSSSRHVRRIQLADE
jgi:hypothetical protein